MWKLRGGTTCSRISLFDTSVTTKGREGRDPLPQPSLFLCGVPSANHSADVLDKSSCRLCNPNGRSCPYTHSLRQGQITTMEYHS